MAGIRLSKDAEPTFRSTLLSCRAELLQDVPLQHESQCSAARRPSAVSGRDWSLRVTASIRSS